MVNLGADCDSVAGDSGGPLFLVHPKTGQPVCVYGVVNVSDHGCNEGEQWTASARVYREVERGLFHKHINSNLYYTVEGGQLIKPF